MSRAVASLSPEALGLFCLIIPQLNSYGKMDGNPYTIKGIVCRHIDWLSLEKIKECLIEINEKTNIKWWEDEEGHEWIHALSFRKHQPGLRKYGEDVLPNYPGVELNGPARGRYPTEKLRREIYNRDNYTCQYCHEDLKDKRRAMCLDHVIPHSTGGTNSKKNLITACKRCNSKKGDKDPSKAKMPWPEGFGEKSGEFMYKDALLTGGQGTVNGGSATVNGLGHEVKEEVKEEVKYKYPPYPPRGGDGVKNVLLKNSVDGEQTVEAEMVTGRAKTRNTGGLTKQQQANFERFWGAYPKKISKGQARQTWKKLNPNEQLQGKILATLEYAKTSDQWAKENGRYIPHASTWLNAEGWEDEHNSSESSIDAWLKSCADNHEVQCESS
jgi:hypothetical protein